MARRGTRPARGEIDEAALRLLARHGGQILATARRHAVTPEDAEDAYQRGIEILLTKAPSTSDDELIPWLKTVVKHEAWALRRQRERHSPVTDDGELRDRPAPTAVTHEQAERLERLRLGAEALGHLKPHEVRALRLKAEGFSYREICAMTGWSYTKVNRLLTEGRQAFLRRVSGIERGAECARYEALLSALADGEASAEQLAILRPHMRTCLSCRARLREFRATPERVAALVPPVALVTSGGAGPLRGLLESVVGTSERFHAAAELATGQKLAAVAASAAALAGGGTAIDEFANHRGPPRAGAGGAGAGGAREGRGRGRARPGATLRAATRSCRTRSRARAARPRGSARAATTRSRGGVRTRRRRTRAGRRAASVAAEQLRSRRQRPHGRLGRRQRRVRAVGLAEPTPGRLFPGACSSDSASTKFNHKEANMITTIAEPTAGLRQPAPQSGYRVPAPVAGLRGPAPVAGYRQPAPQAGLRRGPAPQAGHRGPAPAAGFLRRHCPQAGSKRP